MKKDKDDKKKKRKEKKMLISVNCFLMMYDMITNGIKMRIHFVLEIKLIASFRICCCYTDHFIYFASGKRLRSKMIKKGF